MYQLNIALVISLFAESSALATPCLNTGNKNAYMTCIASQSSANEDAIGLMEQDLAALDTFSLLLDADLTAVEGRVSALESARTSAETRLTVLETSQLDASVRLAALESGSAASGELLDTIAVGSISVAGVALRVDRSGNEIRALSSGAVYAYNTGDTFTLAPLQLPDGVTITAFECTLRDQDSAGYIQAVLKRADRYDTSAASSAIATAVTWPATNSASYTRYSGTPNSSYTLVDNAQFTYYLRVDLYDVVSTASEIAVMGCTVSYSY